MEVSAEFVFEKVMVIDVDEVHHWAAKCKVLWEFESVLDYIVADQIEVL